MRKFPALQQMDLMDCGPTCLRMIARHYGRTFDAEFMHEKCAITREGVSLAGISDAAEAIGMSALAVEVPYRDIARRGASARGSALAATAFCSRLSDQPQSSLCGRPRVWSNLLFP